MCTILLAWHNVNDADFVMAANRDELIERPAEPPQLLFGDPPIVGGRDLLGGGTWLAIGEGERVCAVTNRRTGIKGEVIRDPSRLSRGDIPVDVLRRAERDVPAFLAGLGPGRYNPVNVLYVSPSAALAASVDDSGPPRLTELHIGLHVLTTGDIDDADSDKNRWLYTFADRTQKLAKNAFDLEYALRDLMSRHDKPSDDPLDCVCIHGDVYGTVSAATVIGAHGAVTYRHAQGRPCNTPFSLVDLADLGG
ncbi:MAG: NRDE family protein [Candidatus Dormibacteraeota bacterium]|nr:NRDE family protein [Candidatus Dormibacteraeota bacterium]